MKFFVATFAIITGLHNNAMAQTDPSQLVSTAADPIGEMSLEACRADLRQCLENLSSQAEDYTALLRELARRMGYASVDDMLAADCRGRNGTWSGGECRCASPRAWYTDQTQECCVENTRAYERRMRSCLDSGGRHSCRGGCRCPMGTQLLDGRCQGEATTRQEITNLRIIRDERVPALEAQIANLERELRAAHETGEDQAERIADLERQLAAAQRELEFLRDILARRDIPIPSDTERDPLVPSPDILGEATDPMPRDPMAPVPPGDGGETDENWCEANPGLCAVAIIGALAAAGGLTIGAVCAAGHCSPDRATVNWYR